LFEAIRSVARNGSAVLLVTHRLEEVYEVCDRVCVLRDGRRVGTRDVSTTPERELISMILGRTLGDLHTTRTEQRRRDVVLRVEGLSGAFVSELTFELYEGEILGMTGLVGMGQDEVPYLLVGASRQRAGRVTMNGRVLVNSSPRHARQAGVVVLPANRAQDGGVPDLTVGENVSLPVLGSYYSRRWLHRAEERDAMRSLLKAFEVRPSEPERLLSTLSGGNQQKALVAKWLQLSPKVMILHEPTQGVDIGSRREIFGLLRKAAGRGSSIILVSSDHEELAHLCDRVLVFRHGRLSSVLTGGAVAADRIAERCYATGPAPQES
jgi:ABC-type sugar transport system ATPase subunit